MFARGLLALLVALWIPQSRADAASDALVVQTASGPVRGIAGAGVREFRAIPYAASTAGALRWTRAVPPAPWTGVRDATRWKHGCPQVERYGVTESSIEEDCLHLNVAVPDGAHAGARPVLVWIHGGAWVGGSNDIYPIDHLARETGLVVVAINYRLGALGFLAHPAFERAANGALGLDDQRLALRWVQRNIAAFGGDPARVTVAGESAGAASVCLQLAAPEHTEGLFQRAIVQSAGCTARLRTVPEAEGTGTELAQALGCGDPGSALECLRSVPLERLLAEQTALAARAPLVFTPSFGTQVLPRDGTQALRSGRFLRVPILNGGNRDEMRLYVGYEVVAGARVDAANYLERLGALYGEHAPAIAARYPPGHFPAPASALGTVMSDFHPAVGLSNCLFLRTAELARRFVPVWEYEFTDRAAPPVMPDPGFELGAVHSAELPYFFPGFTNKRVFDGPALAPGSRRLATQMLAWWAAFARDGEPAVEGLPRWPRYEGGESVMRLDPSGPDLFDAEAAHQCAFWRGLYPEALGG